MSAAILPRTDLWDRLSETREPILVWGTGDGADKLFDLCKARGIEIDGVFASDGFVRNRSFRSFPVLSYAACKERYGHFTVLMAFASSRPEVLENAARIDAEQTLIIPDLPLFGDTVFDAAFLRERESELALLRERLADEESRMLFDRLIAARLSGSLRDLLSASSPDPSGLTTLLHPASFRLAADLGAYTGDTALSLAAVAPHIERIVCLEPDPSTFRRMERNLGAMPWYEGHAVAAWDEHATLSFRVGGSRSSRLGGDGKQRSVTAVPLDEILDGRRCDFIKYDVEGADRQALSGSRKTILAHHPALLLSLYHRSEDLLELPRLLLSIRSDYCLCLRRARSLPAWDVNLIALPER